MAPDPRGNPSRQKTATAAAHDCLLARGEGRPRASAGAGPAGGCRRRGEVGKSDASRGSGSASGRPVADRGDRGALRGSAGAGGQPRGDSGPGLPADTGGYSRHGPDHTRDRGRRAAGTTGRPASGGSPRPRGPGDVRRAVDKCAGVCDNSVKPPTPPRGGCARGPGGPALGPHPSTSGVAAAYPKTDPPSTLSSAECPDLSVFRRALTKGCFFWTGRWQEEFTLTAKERPCPALPLYRLASL